MGAAIAEGKLLTSATSVADEQRRQRVPAEARSLACPGQLIYHRTNEDPGLEKAVAVVASRGYFFVVSCSLAGAASTRSDLMPTLASSSISSPF